MARGFVCVRCLVCGRRVGLKAATPPDVAPAEWVCKRCLAGATGRRP